MKLYRFVSEEEIDALKKEGRLFGGKVSRFKGGLNTASYKGEGVFFTILREEGYYFSFMHGKKDHFFLEIEVQEDDTRIIEEFLGEYEDYLNFDFDPDDPERSKVYCPEVILANYALNDVVRIVDTNEAKPEEDGYYFHL